MSLALEVMCHASRTTAGSAALLVVLLANPLGARDRLIRIAADQAQRKADRVVRVILGQFETTFPASVVPPRHYEPTTATATGRRP